MKRTTFKASSLAVLSLLVTGCFNSTTLPEGTLVYATLEINPGVGLMIDENNRIAYTHALNGDGEMLLLNLQLEGKQTNDALDDITDEMVALEFMAQSMTNAQLNMDCLGTTEGVQNQLRTQIQTRMGNALNGHMMNIQMHTRTYTSSEIAEAATKGTTPLKLRLVKQVLVGHDDMLEEEALMLSHTELMQQAKLGATHMKQIASTLVAAFIEERQAIQATYIPQIQALKVLIAEGIANSEDVSDLQLQLTTIRTAMVAAIQDLVADFRQQTIQARTQWQTEANNRRVGGNSGSQEGASQT